MKSDNSKVREAALKKIMSIRSEEQAKKPEAIHWLELISLSQSGIWEPDLTENISDQALQEALLNGSKLVLPDLPSHSQSVERAVKLRSVAAHTLYGLEEARQNHIIAKAVSREMRPAFASLRDLAVNIMMTLESKQYLHKIEMKWGYWNWELM